MVNAMLSGMKASGSQFGEWYVPNKHFMYSAQVEEPLQVSTRISQLS
jgi:hypothetical protein